jgi:hypothetical protein
VAQPAEVFVIPAMTRRGFLRSRSACARPGVRAEMDRKDEALREGIKALEVSPDDAMMHDNCACLYARLGETTTALETLTPAMIKGRWPVETRSGSGRVTGSPELYRAHGRTLAIAGAAQIESTF